MLLATAIYIASASFSPPLPLRTGAEELNMLWRMPGRDGQSCAHCHTPDGIEIVRSKIGTEHILRRARKHLDAGSALALVTAIATAREALKPEERVADHPLVPGGSILNGDTPADRDLAFGRQLAGLGVMRPLASKQQVQDAVKNLLAIDLAKLQVGIPMDPLSRDPFREHHSLLGDWIPDRAPQSSIEAFTAEYDAYCLNPSEEALRSLQAAMEKQAKPKNGIEQLSLFKALSLLEYQHVLRTGKRPATIPAQPGPLCSPIWAVGNFAREQAESIGGDIGLTDGDYQAMGIGKNRNTGLGDSSAGWMWLGWVADPSLQHVSLDKLARNGNYFTQTLYEQGPYPIHAAFVVMRRILSEREERTVFQPDYGALVNQGALKLFEPKSPASRALFKSLLANLLTISAHLVLEDAAQRREIDNPAGALQQMRALREYVPTKDSTVGRAMTYLLPLAKKQQGD